LQNALALTPQRNCPNGRLVTGLKSRAPWRSIAESATRNVEIKADVEAGLSKKAARKWSVTTRWTRHLIKHGSDNPNQGNLF